MRRWLNIQGIGPDTFAGQRCMEIKDVARLEMSQVIPCKILKKIVAKFRIPLAFLKETEELLPFSYTVTNYITFTGNGPITGVNLFNGPGWETTTIHSSPTIYPLDKICEIYERRIKELEYQKQVLEQRIAALEKGFRPLRRK